MSRPAITVAPEMLISEFIDRILDKHRFTSYPVAQNGRLHGMLHLEKLRGLPETEWDKKTVREVMLPVNDTFFVPAKASLEFATSKIKATPLHHLAIQGRFFLSIAGDPDPLAAHVHPPPLASTQH